MSMSPRLLRPRQTGFDPRSIADMVLWLDASDITKLTRDGTAVTAWASGVGSASVTQGVTNNAPTYESSVAGLNNKPALSFNGTNNILLNTSTGLFATGEPAMTLIVAHRPAIATGSRCLFDIAQSSSYLGTGTIRRFFSVAVYGSPGHPYWAFGGRDATYANSATSANTAYVHSLVLPSGNSSATNPTYYRNGTSSARTSAGADGSVTFTPDRFSIGSSSQGVSEFYSGHIAEVLFYSRALSDAERLRIERYLGAKYGITVA